MRPKTQPKDANFLAHPVKVVGATEPKVNVVGAAHPLVIDKSVERKKATEAEAQTTALTPLGLIEKRTLATGAGQPCKKCKKPLPCDVVRVEKGQAIKVNGMPFIVGVRADFEMCCRCGSFFLTQQRA